MEQIMPDKIIIPQKLETQLLRSNTYHGYVTALCTKVSRILAMSPVFFPNYTIHGLDHINEVLKHASNLITSASFSEDPDDAEKKGLTPRDVAYLVSAILIHDLGMFPMPDGIRDMIDGEWGAAGTNCLGDKTWDEEWGAYISRAKRYSPEKKTVLFGSDIPIDAGCFRKQVYNDNAYLVIGEFLRQHHPRLAHEIAMAGMPGSTSDDLFEKTDFDHEERELIGLLARSHGMSLREAEKCTAACFGSDPKPLNTPIFYLMAVLRIADYLDAGKHRAPVSREHLQEIRVSISKDEWNWNQCITKEKCQWQLEQKNRKIQAKPTNSIEYVQLKRWLTSVQEELDVSWAVLAEKYPSEPYRLSIHRITSNIYEDTYDNFLPREARLTANPKILPQLIAPLYGDNPSFGIRELVQNAVDACIEREYFEQNHPQGDKNYSGHVKVEIDTRENKFTITDNGIGMDENVLLNYYLSAGSSYRSSEEWKEAYTRDNVSQVARTGKFGIGFLAGFLLGDTITVTTRHRKENRGYKFSFTTQSRLLCVERVSTPTCGTTISIKMKEGALEKLVDPKDPTKPLMDEQYRHVRSFINDWASPMDSVTCWSRWYAYDDPVVEYFVDDQSIPSGELKLSRNPQDNPAWLELETDAYEFYLWRYEPALRPLYHSPKFYCNGIRIYGAPERKITKYGLDVGFPQIAISDPHDNLNIDLARSKVQVFPEEEKLAREICRYHVAKLLMTRWETPEDYARYQNNGTWIGLDDIMRANRFLLTPQGFQLSRNDICGLLSCERYIGLFYNGDSPKDAAEEASRFVQPGIPVSIVYSKPDPAKPYNTDAMDLFLNAFVPQGRTPDMLFQEGNPLLCSCSNLWISQDIYSNISRNLSFDLPGNGTCSNPKIHAWKLNPKNVPNSAEMPIDDALFDPKHFLLAAEMCPPEVPDTSLFLQQLQELLTPDPGYPRQDMWIPFDMAERKKKFPKAFEALDYYIQKLRNQ